MQIGELVATLRVNLSDFKRQMAAATSEIDRSMNRVSASFSRSGGGLNELTSGIRTLKSSGKDMGTAMKGASKQVNKATESVNALKREMRGLGDGTEDASKKARKAIKDLDDETRRYTWNVRGYLKDTGRVVTGILIAQGFYKVLNSVEQSISSVYEFNNQLQQAAISFKILLGSEARAQRFMRVLEDFAATTPFSFKDAQLASQQLMFMGFQAENIIPIMRDLMDAAAMRGANPTETIQSLTRALGQMRTRGIVTQQELNQLTEAGIPAVDILQKKLGLTAEQLGNIGNERIPAYQALVAIFEGVRELAGGATQDLQQTTSGLTNTIKDNFLIIANEVVRGPLEKFRLKLVQVANTLDAWKKTIRSGGTGALMEQIVPPNLHSTIRLIVGSFKSLGRSLKEIWASTKPLVKILGGAFLQAVGTILPIVAGLVRGIQELVSAMLSAGPVVRFLASAIIGLGIAYGISFAVTKLQTAIKGLAIAQVVAVAVKKLRDALIGLNAALTKNKLLLVIMTITAALVGLAMSSKTVSDWLDRMMSKLAKLGGFSMEDVLNPAPAEDINAVIDEFNKELADSADLYANIGAEAENAKKATDAWLASFDEVFNIPDDKGGALDLDNLFGPGLPKDGGGGGTPPTQGPPNLGEDVLSNINMPSQIYLPELKWRDGQGPQDAVKVLETALEEMITSVARQRTPLVTGWTVTYATLYSLSLSKWEEIKVVWNSALESLKSKLLVTAPKINLTWDTTMQTLENRLRTAVPVVTTTWQVFLNSLETALNAKLPTLQASWQLFLEQFSLGLAQKVPTVTTTWNALLDGIKNYLDLTSPTILSSWQGLLNDLQTRLAAKSPVVLVTWQTLLNSLKTQLDVNSPITLAAWQFFLDSAKLQLEIAKPLILATWQSILDGIQIRTGLSSIDILSEFAQLYVNIQGSINSFKPSVSNVWKEVMAGLSVVTANEVTRISGEFDSMINKAKTAWGKAKEYANKVQEILSTIDANAHGFVDAAVNSLTLGLSNKLLESIGEDTSNQNTVGGTVGSIVGGMTAGGAAGSVGKKLLPKLGDLLKDLVPGFETGGIVSRDRLIRVGERNKPEAIVPLQNESAMAPFADAIATRIGDVLGELGIETTQTTVIVNAGVLVADQGGLKELNRRLQDIALLEDTRKTGRV